MWSVSQLAGYLDVARSTIHRRTETYEWALSEQASPGRGKERRYTPRDVAIMIAIDEMLADNTAPDEVERTLHQDIDRGQFENVTTFPPDPEPEGGVIPVYQHRELMAQAKTTVDLERGRADRAEEQLAELREAKAKLEGQLEEVRKQYESLQGSLQTDQGTVARIISLEKSLAALEAENRYLKAQLEEARKRRGLFGR